MHLARSPRVLLATAAAAVAVAAVAAAPASAETGAAARPPAPQAVYCSPSGDYCLHVRGTGRAAILELRMAAPYFRRYRLCVLPPRGAATCRSFPIRKRTRSVYASSVRWSAHFPDRGAGTYRVSWRSPFGPLGRPLIFRVRSG